MRRIAELYGHPIEIGILCGCTTYRVVAPGWFADKLGPDPTIEEAERRLKCSQCGQRPKLKVKMQYAYAEGRDRRKDPPPVPDWVVRRG